MTFPPLLPPGAARPAANAAFARMSATVAVAYGLALTGRAVDLTGLDATAGILCAQVLDLPPTEGAELRNALAGLESRLTALAAALQRTS